jgi:hypothetical protein
MVVKTPKKGDVSVAEYLTFQLNSSKKTQREIANEIGYTNANVITMFKQGLTKIPVHVAPKLAAAIGIDPGHFLRMCMNEYMPELLPEIEIHLGGLCTKNEMAMIKAIRTVTKDADPVMDKEQEKKLLVWARDL